MTGAEDRPPARARESGSPAQPPSDISTDGLPLAAVSGFQELQRCLRSVFGAAGSELLYRRSLIGAAASHPVLSGVDAAASADSLVQTLQAEAADRPAEVGAALHAIMAGQRSLLERLIGEELLGAVLLGRIEPPPSPEADREPRPDE